MTCPNCQRPTPTILFTLNGKRCRVCREKEPKDGESDATHAMRLRQLAVRWKNVGDSYTHDELIKLANALDPKYLAA